MYNDILPSTAVSMTGVLHSLCITSLHGETTHVTIAKVAGVKKKKKK